MSRLACTAWLAVLWAPSLNSASEPKEKDEKRAGLIKEAQELTEKGLKLYKAGEKAEGKKAIERSLALFRRAYPATDFPDGNADLARSFSNVAFVYRLEGRHEEALTHYREALSIYRRLFPAREFPNGQPDFARCLVNVAISLRSLDRPDQALPYFEEALVMHRALFPEKDFPNGHADLAANIGNLGGILRRMGRYDQALPLFEEALAMNRRLYPAKDMPQGHNEIAASLDNLASVLRSMGRFAQAVVHYEEEVAMLRQLYPAKDYPNGEPRLARGISNLAGARIEMGRAALALPELVDALAMYERLYPQKKFPEGHPDVAGALNNLGYGLRAVGRYEQALPYYERALEMRRRLYAPERSPNGHPEITVSLNNVGDMLQTMGRYEQGLALLEESVAMRRRLYPRTSYPRGHPSLALGLNNLAALLDRMGRHEQALPYHEESLAMYRRLYSPKDFPAGHPELATSITNLAGALRSMGRPERALPYYEEALAMSKRLFPEKSFPRGHPILAGCHNNLAMVLSSLGRRDKALTYHEEALAIRRRLYPQQDFPNGHTDLASSLNNVGATLGSLQKLEKALPYFDEALQMRRKLFPEKTYPRGHVDLILSLNNLAGTYARMGRQQDAVTVLEEALAMGRRLFPAKVFPHGNTAITTSLDNLANLLRQSGRPKDALVYYEESLALSRGLIGEQALLASEADAFDLLRTLPPTRDAYLSTALRVPNTDAAAYRAVWDSKAQLTRVLERRLVAVRLALASSQTNNGLRAKWEELLALRRRITQLLQSPSSPERERLLTNLTDAKELRERELVKLLPEIEHLQVGERVTPDQLAARLPAKTIFIDFVRYQSYPTDFKEEPPKIAPRRDHYAAFILTAKNAPVRVELGPAKPIDDAINEWRQRIVNRQEDAAVAAEVRRLVWMPLGESIPTATDTVYIAPDGDLARLPFAALPGKEPGRVLLDEIAVGVVPHGPFLLKQLLAAAPSTDGPESVLAIGGVRYGAGDVWPALDGTSIEVKHIGELSAKGRKVTTLTGNEANTFSIVAELPRVRYAHFATHGFFAASELADEEKRRREYFEQLRNYQFVEGKQTEHLGGAGKRNPLGYVGLVLAGANEPDAAALPAATLIGGVTVTHWPSPIIHGDRIAQLSLNNLKLCVLSACETGLGELTGGEGVQGLQRAFHLAGCPNVIASLWNVNDKATAALMNKFYEELWVNEKPPLEALRLAQLTILRHPERVADLADRAAPNFRKTVALPPDKQAPKDSGRTPTKLWAAFVLSGTGR